MKGRTKALVLCTFGPRCNKTGARRRTSGHLVKTRGERKEGESERDRESKRERVSRTHQPKQKRAK